MVDKYPWAKALNIPEQHLTLWRSEVPAQVSLLAWCMDHNKVNETIYLQWAKNHYGLPVLSHDFFELTANPEFFQSIQSVAPWNETMIPLHQWDGTVFIACLEPPQDVSWSFNVQYLLAPYSCLKSHWEALLGRKEKTVTQVHTQVNLPPTPMATALKKAPLPKAQPQAQTQDDDLILDLSSDEGSSDNVIESLGQNSEDLPDGLDGASISKSGRILEGLEGFDELENSLGNEKPSASKKAKKSEEDELLNFGGEYVDEDSQERAVSEADASKSFLVDDLLDEPASSMPSMPSVPTGISKVSTKSGLNLPPPADESFSGKSNPSAKPMPPLTSPVMSSLSATLDKMPQSPKDFTDESPQTKSNIRPTTQSLVTQRTVFGTWDMGRPLSTNAPKGFSVAKDADEAIAFVFAQLRAVYRHCVLLRQSREGFVPWRWDDSLKFAAEKVTPIDLTPPSLFKIVAKSRHPYHGHVVRTSVNETFFKQMGFKEMPPHVTAHPLIVNKTMFGILLGCSQDSSITTNMQALALMTKLNEQLTDYLSRSQINAA